MRNGKLFFQGFARKAYASDLAARGLDTAEIEKSVEVLSAWLKANAGDVSAQFGITLQQLEGVVSNYQNAYADGVAQVLWIGAGVAAIGAVLAWFTFQRKG